MGIEVGLVRLSCVTTEDSPDPDDFLGRITISESELNQGLRSQDFRGDDAHYTLFYRVDQVAHDD